MLLPLALSSAALVLANLVPLAGVLLGLWSVAEIMILFWAENVVIGLFNLLRMGTVLLGRRKRELLFMMPFFALHYGGFAAVHGLFVLHLFGTPGLADFAEVPALLLSPGGLLWPLLALAASHGLSFALNFLGAGEWRRIEPNVLMVQPYGRVIVLHLVIIAGGAVALALGAPLGALALLVLLKIGADLAAHRREHGGAGAMPARSGSRQRP